MQKYTFFSANDNFLQIPSYILFEIIALYFHFLLHALVNLQNGKSKMDKPKEFPSNHTD